MVDKKYSLVCCIVYMIGVIAFAYVNFKLMCNFPSVFNTIVTILHVPFIIIMIICAIKAFQDYKKEKDEINKE